MPSTNVKFIEGVFTKEEQTQLIEQITESIIEEGGGVRAVTWVIIEEVKSGDWATGSEPVSPKAKER